MDFNEALETIVEDMHGSEKSVEYIVENFLIPISLLRTAKDYSQREDLYNKYVASDMLLRISRQITYDATDSYKDFYFLLSRLCSIECSAIIAADGPEEWLRFAVGDINTQKTMEVYDKLKSPAEICLVDFYFGDTITKIKELSKSA